MGPRPHSPILSRNNTTHIKLYDPQILQDMNPLTIFLYSYSKNNKQPVAKNLKQWKILSSESGVSRIKLYYIWVNDPRCGCIF